MWLKITTLYPLFGVKCIQKNNRKKRKKDKIIGKPVGKKGTAFHLNDLGADKKN